MRRAVTVSGVSVTSSTGNARGMLISGACPRRTSPVMPSDSKGVRRGVSSTSPASSKGKSGPCLSSSLASDRSSSAAVVSVISGSGGVGKRRAISSSIIAISGSVSNGGGGSQTGGAALGGVTKTCPEGLTDTVAESYCVISAALSAGSCIQRQRAG